MRLGIDFGTTRTVVACADRGNYPVVSFYDDDGDAHDFIPSVVAERNGELLFGFDAVAASADPSSTTLRSFKRLLADADAGPEKRVRVGSVTLTIDALVTGFLAATRRAILERSNVGADDEPMRVVAAVPANASGAARFVTLDAFRRAGFVPVLMLNEPSAAGFEYTHRHRDTLSKKREHVVVFDLGGGTFDVSLLRMSGKAHEVVATAGINRLGGDDFDDILLRLALAKAGTSVERLEERVVRDLLDQCRDAKERLNPSSRKLVIELPDGPVTVPVSELYDACLPLILSAVEAMVPVMDLAKDEIAGIYVVGGGSELPVVARVLRERFGRRVHRSPYASAAVAIGLAIACDDEAGYELADRLARTFGVFREASAGADITCDAIFGSGAPLPARQAEPLRSRRRYRAAHNVGHFRFFECNAMTADGHPRGDMIVSGDVVVPFDPALDTVDPGSLAGVPVRRLTDVGPLIEEEYSLDESGLVAVRIRNVDSGQERLFRLGAPA